MIISLTDTMTSLLAGVTIFAVLGNLAQATGVGIESVLQGSSGPGLAFISYPEAIAQIGVFPQVSIHILRNWVYWHEFTNINMF